MTEKTFTIEDLEKQNEVVGPFETVAELLASLKKPEIGQVLLYVSGRDGEEYDKAIEMGKVNCQPVIDALNEPPKDYDELMVEFVKLRSALIVCRGYGNPVATRALATVPEGYRGK